MRSVSSATFGTTCSSQPTPELSLDRCDALLAAGLVSDALAEADDAVRDIEQARGRSTKKAELLLAAANCALAAAQPQEAMDRAQEAYRLFRSQQNAWLAAHARLVLIRAQYAVGPVTGRLLRAANLAAIELEELGSGEAANAHLLAGRAALDLGRRAEADRHLTAVARSRRRGPAMARATGWLGEALPANAAGQPRRLLGACRRGLEVLDEHRFTLGAAELRAQATAHGAEVPLVAQLYDEVTVLSDGEATAGQVLSALDGAWLAHIAAHGRFRADSPLFSSLRMHDGPLTVYDFEQLGRAPYRLVLSSCDSGLLAPVGADELLGLVSSLLPLGTAGIIASVVPLNDQAAVPVMVALHRYLRTGQTFAESMHSVRQETDGDLIQRAAAVSLLALGAG